MTDHPRVIVCWFESEYLLPSLLGKRDRNQAEGKCPRPSTCRNHGAPLTSWCFGAQHKPDSAFGVELDGLLQINAV